MYLHPVLPQPAVCCSRDNAGNKAPSSQPPVLRSRTPGLTKSDRKAGAVAHSRFEPVEARASQLAETEVAAIVPREVWLLSESHSRLALPIPFAPLTCHVPH